MMMAACTGQGAVGTDGVLARTGVESALTVQSDLDAAQAFYTAIFDYSWQEAPGGLRYATFSVGSHLAGGALAIPEQWHAGNRPVPRWLTYFGSTTRTRPQPASARSAAAYSSRPKTRRSTALQCCATRRAPPSTSSAYLPRRKDELHDKRDQAHAARTGQPGQRCAAVRGPAGRLVQPNP